MKQPLIWRWLDAFPEEVQLREPVLQLWRGHLLSRSGQHIEAARNLGAGRLRVLFGMKPKAAAQPVYSKVASQTGANI